MVSNIFIFQINYGGTVNYKKFAQDNQKKFGYKILEMNDVFITIKRNIKDFLNLKIFVIFTYHVSKNIKKD